MRRRRRRHGISGRSNNKIAIIELNEPEPRMRFELVAVIILDCGWRVAVSVINFAHFIDWKKSATRVGFAHWRHMCALCRLANKRSADQRPTLRPLRWQQDEWAYVRFGAHFLDKKRP